MAAATTDITVHRRNLKLRHRSPILARIAVIPEFIAARRANATMGYAHDIHLYRDFAAAAIRTLLSCLEIPMAWPTGSPETLPVVGVNHTCVGDPEDLEYHTFKRCNWRR